MGWVDLKLGFKGFFTTIFASIEYKEHIFEDGPYFNSRGLHL
jgi:hypothetical protein